MPSSINYRKQLLRAIEAFLEKTSESVIRARRIIERCNRVLGREDKEMTLDSLVWGFYCTALSDSIYYQSEDYLHEIREILLGSLSQTIARIVISRDYRFPDDIQTFFTTEEAEWYAQLLSLIEFLEKIPYEKISQATEHLRQQQDWERLRLLPEYIQAQKIDEEYLRKKERIEALAARVPVPENLGDEKIYHLVLREVTAWIIGLRVGMTAVWFGYPILDVPYTKWSSSQTELDISERVRWAKRMLEGLAGKENLFFSWRLGKASTFGADILVISLS